MLVIKAFSICVSAALLFSGCGHWDNGRDAFTRALADCDQEKTQMIASMEELNQKINTLNTKTDELDSRRSYFSYKAEKLELELLKRDAVIQIQENVIQLLDDSGNTIETSLKNEINTKLSQIEESHKKRRRVCRVEDLFKPKTLDISSKGEEKLIELAEGIKNNKKQRIYIEGHTDNVGLSPSTQKRFPSNWEISVARSAAVARFLQTRAGIEPKRLVIVGHGGYKPVASNQTEEGRRLNRRVEIILGPPL
ncbi:MAG: OmpA family protein [Proteobacteria bacterium]|nr:OmpA family protein [Pseudomonadota bacterium]MBU4470844.1 OmpA family protein [Pseudomonadota bacterium]MCG2753764.1 OmpA family protein [Desulfobacteraceae bacterium]